MARKSKKASEPVTVISSNKQDNIEVGDDHVSEIVDEDVDEVDEDVDDAGDSPDMSALDVYLGKDLMKKLNIQSWTELLEMTQDELMKKRLSKKNFSKIISGLESCGFSLKIPSCEEVYVIVKELKKSVDAIRNRANNNGFEITNLDFSMHSVKDNQRMLEMNFEELKRRFNKWLLRMSLLIIILASFLVFFIFRGGSQTGKPSAAVVTKLATEVEKLNDAELLIAQHKDVVLVVPGEVLMSCSGSDSLSVNIMHASAECSAILLSSVPGFEGETTVTVKRADSGNINISSYVVKRDNAATQTIYDMRK